MKSTSFRIWSAALAASFLLAGALSAEAAPLVAPKATFGSSNLVKVQSGGGDNSFGGRSGRSGFERRGGTAYYNGHRGYSQHRHGYQYHNGYWFPAAAFVAGAVIGGAIVAPPVYAAPAPVYAAPPPSAHVDWCLRHYRSYNPYDNTFQPYGGPRMYCHSPYSG